MQTFLTQKICLGTFRSQQEPIVSNSIKLGFFKNSPIIILKSMNEIQGKVTKQPPTKLYLISP